MPSDTIKCAQVLYNSKDPICARIGLYFSYLFALPDPGNMGVAVGMSLLSCIRAEIYAISYTLPVSGRHVCFMTHPEIAQ